MRRLFTASILFCFALLMQVLSPVASGVAMEFAREPGAAPGVILCHALHSGGGAADENLGPFSSSDQAPASGGTHHNHHSCSLCQIGSSAALHGATVASAAGPIIIWVRLNRIGRAEHAALFRFIRSAYARAPPPSA